MNTICPIWIRSSLSFISHQLLTWLMIHNLPKRIHSMVGLSTVRVGSGLGSTCIRLDLIGWSHHQLAADREDDRIKWVGASTNVRQIRWGWRFGKQRESSYMKNSWNLARKKNWKTAKIWQYLTQSSKISAIFDKILARSSEISPDLAYIFLKISQNSLNLQYLAEKTNGLVGSGCLDLWGGDSTSNLPILFFGERNLLPTAKAIGSVDSRSGSIKGSEWVGSGESLDRPTKWIVLHSRDKLSEIYYFTLISIIDKKKIWIIWHIKMEKKIDIKKECKRV